MIQRNTEKQIDVGSWKEFSEKHWEMAPVLLDLMDTLNLPTISEDRLFCALLSCCEAYQSGQFQRLRFSINGEDQDVFTKNTELLPKESDLSFDGYHSRVSGILEEDNYSIIVADWHRFDRAFWDQLVLPISELGTQVGLSTSRMDTNLFVGNYRTTSFGIHQDQSSGFMFPVIGSKQMHFWENSYAKANPQIENSHDVDGFLSAGTSIRANPGQGIYWPSDAWHIATGNGEINVAWRFGYWMADGLFRIYLDELERSRVQQDIDTMTGSLSGSGGGDTLDDILRVIDSIHKISSSNKFKDNVVTSYLRKISAFGFLRIPEIVRSEPFLKRETVQLKPPFKIHIADCEENLTILAAAGRSITLRKSTTLLNSVRSLNTGEKIDLSTVKNQRSCELSRLITFLAQAGVLGSNIN